MTVTLTDYEKEQLVFVTDVPHDDCIDTTTPGTCTLFQTVEDIIAERLDSLALLHHQVQWRGWRLWMLRIGREPLAYVDSWCRECRKPWPCPTAEVLPWPGASQ